MDTGQVYLSPLGKTVMYGVGGELLVLSKDTALSLPTSKPCWKQLIMGGMWLRR